MSDRDRVSAGRNVAQGVNRAQSQNVRTIGHIVQIQSNGVVAAARGHRADAAIEQEFNAGNAASIGARLAPGRALATIENWPAISSLLTEALIAVAVWSR